MNHHRPNPNDIFLTRREMLNRCGMGMGAMALGGLMTQSGMLQAATAGDIAKAQAAGQSMNAVGKSFNPLAPRDPHFPAKAKHVIHLFMNGGPSHVDTFDPKPALVKYAGQRPPGADLKTERQTFNLFPSPFEFRPSGKSGLEISSLFPRLSGRADDLCVIVSSNSNDKISDQIGNQIRLMLTQNIGMLDEAFIQRFSGRYRLPTGQTFGVQIDETNNLTTFCTESVAAALLISDGTEQPEAVNPVGQRTLKLLEGVQNNDFALLARYRDVSLEEAEKRIKPFWTDMQAERGKITGTDLITVASRQKIGLMLAFVRVNFEKKSLYFMYIWKGERIEDVREMPVIDKTFEWQGSDNTFHAGNNNRTIVAENIKQGTPVLLIKHPKGDVRAVKE